MAGRNDEFRTSRADLLQLHEQTFVSLLAVQPDAVESAAAAAAIVMSTVLVHLAEVFGYLRHNIACVLFQAMVPDVVARILKRTGDLDLLCGIDLDLAGADRFRKPFDIVQERNRRLAVLTAGPIRTFHRRCPVGMTAFCLDDTLGVQTIDSVINSFRAHAAGFPVPCEHGERRVFPSLRRNCPLFARYGKKLSCSPDVFGIDLRLTGIAHIHDVAVRLVDGYLKTGHFFLPFFFHPLAGIDPVFGGDIHLGPVHAVHA